MPSIIKQIAALQKCIDDLTVISQKKSVKKPKKISDCTSKAELKMFTVKELTAWIKKHNVDVKKISEKHKKDFINIIWKHLDTDSEYESDSSTSDYSATDSSDSDTESETDSDSD